MAFLFPFNRLDAIVYDNFMRLRGVTPVSPVPVIVDIDEKSLAKYGQWPWPRYVLADLVKNIQADGTIAVSLDILLAEEDRTSPDYLDWRMREWYGAGLVLEKLPE